jgi:hypothetical protein
MLNLFRRKAVEGPLCDPLAEPAHERHHPVLGRHKVLERTPDALHATIVEARNARNLGAYYARRGAAEAAAILARFEAGA